jgi:hypothetical protein
MASTNVSSAGTGRAPVDAPAPAGLGSSKASSSALRLIQHKREALWFYRFISIGYDHVFNPGQYTEDMRDVAMDEHADLRRPNLKVVDVGGGTGFTTLGIVRHVDPENVTLIDQSPHQLDKARQKKALKGVKIMEGDAEDLPFPADTFDRYVSAGRLVPPSSGLYKAETVCCTCTYHSALVFSKNGKRIWVSKRSGKIYTITHTHIVLVPQVPLESTLYSGLVKKDKF